MDNPENFGERKEKIDFDTQLRIREPERDKHFMITFDGKNFITCEFFNRAIGEILDKEFGFHAVFHQIGKENEPGIHGWEIWGKKDEEMKNRLNGLVPIIQESVRKTSKDYGY